MNTSIIDKEYWTTIITPQKKFIDINLVEVWRYRDLIYRLVHKEFVYKYKQTILGPLWFFIQPLMMSIVFTIVFNQIANIPTDNVPPMMFYLSGLLAWNYFSESLNKTASTFISNVSIFGKVYFPRLCVPISIAITNLLTLGIQMILFIFFYIYFLLKGAPIKPTIWILSLPFLIVQVAVLGLGVGIWISSLTTKYRDLRFTVTFLTQLWMYATPIMYPISQVPEKWHWILWLNPMTGIVETFKVATLNTGLININYLIVSLIMTLAILLSGLVIFTHIEKTFMDTV